MKEDNESLNKASKLFDSPLKVINVGLEVFYQALRDQGAEAIHVSWTAPIKLEKEYEDILSKIL